MKDFVWDDKLVAEFSGRASWVANGNDIPDLMKRFKEEKQQAKQDWYVVSVDTHGITSVIRISDGVRFAIGDSVNYKSEGSDQFYSDVMFINKMNISLDDCTELVFTLTDETGDVVVKYIRNIRKAEKPKPLFVTADGVECFDKEQRLFSVCPKGQWETTEQLKVANTLTYGGWSGWLHFSTRERRDEYVLMNKPLFGIDEIGKEIIGRFYLKMETTDKFWNHLKQLAKEKLNKK